MSAHPHGQADIIKMKNMSTKVKTESIKTSDIHVNNSSLDRKFEIIENENGQIIELRNRNGKISERDFIEVVNLNKRIFVNAKSVYTFECGNCADFHSWIERVIDKFNLELGYDYVELRFDSDGNLVPEDTVASNVEYWIDFSYLSLIRKDLNRKEVVRTYLIRDNENGYIKIGRTKQIERRFRSLKSVYEDITILYLLDKDVEKELHHKYELYRLEGEWFHLSEIQISDIVDLYGFYEFKR